MKLLAASIGLITLELALAQEKYQTYIPYDCYQESDKLYGDSTEKTKISDMEAMTGLDAYGHRLAAISACIDRHTTLISGITTVWGIWDGTAWTDLQRLNIIGRLSGLYEFPDNDVLSEYGLPFLEEGQQLALAHYWYQEASPDQEQLYLIRKSIGEMDT